MYRLIAVGDSNNQFRMSGKLLDCLKWAIYLHKRLGYNCGIYRTWNGTEIRTKAYPLPLP